MVTVAVTVDFNAETTEVTAATANGVVVALIANGDSCRRGVTVMTSTPIAKRPIEPVTSAKDRVDAVIGSARTDARSPAANSDG